MQVADLIYDHNNHTMERPNLKICIENDDNSDSDEDKPIIEVFGDPEVSSETTGDHKGIVLDQETETPQALDLKLKEPDPPQTTLEVSLESDPKTVQQPRRYQNKSGEFVTGFDPLSEEHKELRVKRAQRFGITDNEEVVSEQNLKTLYESLGVNEEGTESEEHGIRLDAIHIRGVNKMSTQDVFKYFQDFVPGSLEWIDDTSCNVVWMDQVTAARAMIHMSRAIKDSETNKKKEQSVSRQTSNSVPSDSKSTDESMDVDDNKENSGLKSVPDKEPLSKDDGFDYDLNLMSESEDSDAEMKESNKSAESASENLTDVPDTEKQTVEKGGENSGEKAGELDNDEKPIKVHSRKRYRIPAGKWRIGLPYMNKAGVIYMRFATKEDKKQRGAAQKSLYYRRYGNPNFGGMKGLISESRKRKIIASKYHQEELEAKKVVMKAKKVTDIPEETAFDKHLQDAVKPGLKSRLELRGSVLGVTNDEEVSEAVVVEAQDEFINVEDELRVLLSESSPPPKKRSMRMYADDIEEELKKSRSSAPHFTESAIESRLKDARELVGDARSRITGRRLGQNTNSQVSAGDLRNILGRKRRQGDRGGRFSPSHQITVEFELE